MLKNDKWIVEQAKQGMTKQRIALDAYYTHKRVTQALLDRFDIPSGWTVIEPCCGDGAIADLFRPTHQVVTNDINPDVEADYHQCAASAGFWDSLVNQHCIDAVITNPPFNQANKIIPLAFNCAQVVVALLRITWVMEPCQARAAFLKHARPYLAAVYPLNPRPRFRADSKGTDSATVAWCIWDRRKRSPGVDLQYITDWRE